MIAVKSPVPLVTDGRGRVMDYGQGLDRKFPKEEDQMRSLDTPDKGTMELADGLLRLRWRAGKTVGVHEAQAALEAIDAFGQGTSLPMLTTFKASISPGQSGGSFLHPRAFPGSRSWGPPEAVTTTGRSVPELR
jgi:hypothetical protein